MAERKTPVLLRRGPLTGKVNALLRYKRKEVNGQEIIEASSKQDVTADFRALMLERLMPPGNEGLQPIIIKAATGEALTREEADLLGDFADRLGDEIRAHAAGPHGSGETPDVG